MLNEARLRQVGFNDPQVIQYILSNPNERSRYERELGLVPTTSGGAFNFDYASETEKAYNDLGKYYEELLDMSNDDINLALSRLQEDFDTGKRFQRENSGISRQTLALARQDLVSSVDTAKRTLVGNQLERGIYNKSNFDQGTNMGLATKEQNRLQENVNRSEQKLDLSEKQFDLEEAQSGELAQRSLTRGQEDLDRQKERYTKSLEEERKQKAGDLASSRAQRAYQRFESQLF